MITIATILVFTGFWISCAHIPKESQTQSNFTQKPKKDTKPMQNYGEFFINFEKATRLQKIEMAKTIAHDHFGEIEFADFTKVTVQKKQTSIEFYFAPLLQWGPCQKLAQGIHLSYIFLLQLRW